MTDYQKILEEFRTHYRNKYDISFDDEILYFFIRVNEMQADIKKDIGRIPKITFKTGQDYFLYGLGKWLIPSLLVIAFFSVSLFFTVPNRHPNQFMVPTKIVTKDNVQYLKLKNL